MKISKSDKKALSREASRRGDRPSLISEFGESEATGERSLKQNLSIESQPRPTTPPLISHGYNPDDGHSYVAENLINAEKVLHKNGHRREKGLDAIKTRIRLLTQLEQQYLRNWLDYLLEEPEDIDPPARSDREVVRRQRVGTIVYQLEKVRCGKATCKSCPHGPYWYGYQRFEGKFKSFYIGKKTPVGV